MAEIRSTMDIIMEKTRGLTMTEQEKREFREKELTGKVKGLVQKVMDGALPPDRFKVEAAPLEEKDRDLTHRLVREEALSRIEPGGSNDAVLQILGEGIGVDTGPIRRLLSEFERDLARERESREKVLEERIRKSGISGSAVRPNIAADPGWIAYVSEKRDDSRQKIMEWTK